MNSQSRPDPARSAPRGFTLRSPPTIQGQRCSRSLCTFGLALWLGSPLLRPFTRTFRMTPHASLIYLGQPDGSYLSHGIANKVDTPLASGARVVDSLDCHSEGAI
ncbi:hypothetical protein OE88DRAFT_729042 [Heliocybe sulcata]|uniref:Uncharacterized protein n=1 Tax=Heliocybe sulcata TaxID=5364 RepID=A0A5C3NEF8_9AGAM|nr:hypothetical protein OE88DRAFT_729042 [Heliocybe sulcata]